MTFAANPGNDPIGALIATKTWTGTTSTAWNKGQTGARLSAPTSSELAILPSGPSNQPTVSTAVTPGAVAVNAGATLTVATGGTVTISRNPGSFVIDGTVQMTGSGQITSAAGGSQSIAINAGGTLKVNGSNGFPTGFETFDINAASTIEYGATAGQTIEATSSSHTATSCSRGRAVQRPSRIAATSTSPATSRSRRARRSDGVANDEDIDIDGDWTNNGTYTQGAQLVTFSGGAAQVVGWFDDDHVQQRHNQQHWWRDARRGRHDRRRGAGPQR